MAWSKDYGLEARNAAQEAEQAATEAQTAAQEAVDAKESVRTKWLEAVATVSERDSTYPNPQNGDTVRVTEIATTYRFETGTGWVITDIYDASAIDSVTAQLVDKAPLVHTHKIADVNGLQDELDGKLSAADTLTISSIDGLQTELDGKVDETEFTTHKQDLASQAAGKGASLIGVQDVDGLFNATTVEGALKEAKEKADLAFQTGNNVKVDMVAALLAVDPTLLITENSSWSEIETATGQISTGLEEASGSATQQADNTLIVTGLNFQPKIIELRFYNSSNGAKYISIYNVNDPNNFNINSMLTGYSGSSNQLFGVSSWDISASGFSCLIGVNIGTFKWFAWG